MNNSPAQSDSQPRISHILATLNHYKSLVIAPAVIAMALSAVYVSVLRPQSWSAKQSLIVRDDLLGKSFKPGRFESIESMKSAQETILEIARKPQVIINALEKLGPEPGSRLKWGSKQWPDEEMIENVQGSIAFHAPNGAEFGKTEVIVLSSKASTRDRSRKFIELLLNEIILKADEVRSMRLQSMEAELTQKSEAAEAALKESEAKLRAMDESLGSDIGATALINETQSIDNIKQDISQDKRQTESELESLKTALTQLKAAQANPAQMFTTSAALVSLLPALDDLKKALITTQHELAAMAGQYEPAHPNYRKAKNSIDAMKQQMHLELDASITGIQNDIKLTESKLGRLDTEMEELNDRLARLNSKRASLITLETDLRKRTEIANDSQVELAEIQGLLQSKNAELITPVDVPQVSTRPDGMGKKTTVLAAGLGGLMIGLGLVILIAPPFEPIQELDAEDQQDDQFDRTENQSTASYYETRSFEKIIVTAATAAATAIQSASKARQFFSTQKPEQEHPSNQESNPTREIVERAPVESPTVERATQIRSEPAFVKEPKTAVDSSPVVLNTPMRNQPESPATPPVVTPVVSPVSPTTGGHQARTTKPVAVGQTEDTTRGIERHILPSAQTVEPREVLPTSQGEVQTGDTKAHSEVTTPQPRKFIVRPLKPVEKPTAESPANATFINKSSISPATEKRGSQLAAIQLAALSGTQVQPTGHGTAAPTSIAASPGNAQASSAGQAPSPIQVATAVGAETRSIDVSDEYYPGSSQTAPGSPGSDLSEVSDVTRRGSNVRPVDLAKTSEEFDSTFIRNKPTDEN